MYSCQNPSNSCAESEELLQEHRRAQGHPEASDDAEQCHQSHQTPDTGGAGDILWISVPVGRRQE